MKRLLLGAALVAGWVLLAPAALAADPMPHSGRVVISTQGDVAIPSGEQADLVVVVEGTADIRGDVNTLIVVDGTANLSGARLETVVAVTSRVEVLAGTTVLGEVKRLDSTVHQVGDAEIVGGITDLSVDFLEAGAILAPALVLIWLGFGLATITAALLLAGIASRQVRRAEALISREPLPTGLIGLLGTIVLPIGAILAIATLIGAPLGLGFLLGVLPIVAFAGYIVGAIWTGDWILRRVSPGQERERPYLAAVLGVVVLGTLGLVPVLTLVNAVVSLLGFGAIIRLAFGALRSSPRAVLPTSPVAAPSGA